MKGCHLAEACGLFSCTFAHKPFSLCRGKFIVWIEMPHLKIKAFSQKRYIAFIGVYLPSEG